MKSSKVVLTFDSFAGYAKITILDDYLLTKDELIKKWEKETLIFAGRDFGRPTWVRVYNK